MAELNRFGKNFFSKCVAASGARIDLDVEELWVSKYFRMNLMSKTIVKIPEIFVKRINRAGCFIYEGFRGFFPFIY